MELWIRSQDRRNLIKTERLYVSGKNDEYYIGDSLIGHIGIYKTEERALEILDEIQRLITDLQYMSYAVDSSSFYSYRPNVYEMPKE
jgi:hypothetical protein